MLCMGERVKHVPKGPSQFPNIFLIRTCPGTLKPVDYPTLFCDGVLVLGGYQQAMDGVVSSYVTSTPILLHTFLKLSLRSLL